MDRHDHQCSSLGLNDIDEMFIMDQLQSYKLISTLNRHNGWCRDFGIGTLCINKKVKLL